MVEEQQHKINMVEKISGQTLGKQFEMLTMEFLQATFPNLQNLYPGKWSILQLGNNNKLKTSDFEQYEHLAYLKSIVEFSVKRRVERDSDSDYSEQIVPFQIAYAVSIHKAQGLEYKSVKVVITEDIDEKISHNIFYTAITRTTDP